MGVVAGMLTTNTLTISPKMLSLISEIDEFKGAWRALGTLAPERLSALRRVATIESIGSSTRIEGSKLSDAEVRQLLSNIEVQPFETRDQQEVAGYAEAMETIFAAWDQISITENHILQLHRDLLRHSGKDERHRGGYKTASNSIAAFDEGGVQIGVVFETASPFDTPRLMRELLDWYAEQTERKALHPLLIIGIFVVVFLEIHPFQDGNGRLSRVLTTLLMLRAGYSYVPYGSMESVIEQSKEAYYLALRQTQSTIRTAHPDWQPWMEFFLSAAQRQMSRLKTRVERERLMMGALPELAAELVQLTRDHGRLTMAEAARLTGANRNTLKQHFRKLVEDGHLKLHGRARGAWYALP
ncbi:Fic family protein [uncultured Roseobacter sp.]|uniref:Fic family protein n=1 Tax=uncultured Roseobacter sp. TaxID=114847 RepID=UPI00262221D7|nr:Fic family protein [uncultured Roseobacter sp.]